MAASSTTLLSSLESSCSDSLIGDSSMAGARTMGAGCSWKYLRASSTRSLSVKVSRPYSYFNFMAWSFFPAKA